MRHFWDIALEPVLRALAPQRILEIGVDQGLTTKLLIDFVVGADAFLDAIDPDPKIDVADWQGRQPDHVRFHRGLSLDVIPTLQPPDAALLDGDHNWYTVHSELVALEQLAVQAGRTAPVCLIHDVGWPYARRDLYYDAGTVPKPHRHPHERGGLVPDRSEIDERGGFNAHLDHAIFEGGERNGVLTAIEDFVEASAQAWALTIVPGLNGLAIVVPAGLLEEHKTLRNAVTAIGRAPGLRRTIAVVEQARIESETRRQESARQRTEQAAQLERRAELEQQLEQAGEARKLADTQRAEDGERHERELERLRTALDEAESERQSATQRLTDSEAARAQLAEQLAAIAADPSSADPLALRRLEVVEADWRSERRRRTSAERKALASAREQALLDGRMSAQESELAALRDESRLARGQAVAAAEQARVTREELHEVAHARDLAERRRELLERREEETEADAAGRRRELREATENSSDLEHANASLRERLDERERACAAAEAARAEADQRAEERAGELQALIATRERRAADAADARESMERALEDESAETVAAQSQLRELQRRTELAAVEREGHEARLQELQRALSRAHEDAEEARANGAAAAEVHGAIPRAEPFAPAAASAGPGPSPIVEPDADRGLVVEPAPRSAAAQQRAAIGVDFNEHELAAHEHFRREYDCAWPNPGPDTVVDPVALPSVRDARGYLVEEHEVAADGPTVDVVVCVHNALEDLRRCLWSVVHKTDRPYRLVIVNDGSDDPTTRYLQQVVIDAPGTHLIHRSEPPHGYTIAANLGFNAATGDYVVLLNSDTIVTPGWLDRIIDCGESDPKIGILGPLSNAASHQSVPELRDAAGWSTNPLPTFSNPDGIARLLQLVSARERPRIPFVNGFCYVVKRAVIDAIGVFDEEKFASGYCEENDYSMRAAQAGFELAVVDDGYVFHAKSKSFGAEARKVIAKRNYEIFRDKHGRARIDAEVRRLEQSTALAPLRSKVGDALSSPHALVSALDGADHPRLRVMFVLPGLGVGGSGGSHSIYQEVRGMRVLGLDAQIALRAGSLERARAAYDDADQIFVPYRDESELERITASADVIVATHFKSAILVAGLYARRGDFVPAYYVQDYEPFFTSGDSADNEEAYNSYTLIADCLLFAKTHWLCNIVSDRHGVFVAKVEPSIDEKIYRPSGARRPGGPLRVTAMVRPRTPRRQPSATVAVLEQLSRERGVEVTTFGCVPADLERLTDHAPLLAGHRGVLQRRDVADLLGSSDIFLDLSMYQAFGRTALEAMACGCTAVVPRLGGIWEFLEHGVNGLAIDAFAPEEAYAAISDLVDDRARLEALQAGARRTGAGHSIMRAALSEYLVFVRAHALRTGLSGAT